MTNDARTILDERLKAYRDSVGAAADECLELAHELCAGKLGRADNLALLNQLLEALSGLAPDPHTVSCAMLFVAAERGEDLTAIRSQLSAEVNEELEQLFYL
ncbi:MAG: hypothetical protein PVF89_05710, partial [Lysobacterales bacterium]